MSVRVMTMVFDRYPNGGGEMLLALALADHAHDDGTNVYPSIKALAEKTRQSERTVQYQLRRMEESGWLILVNSGNGGRNQTREYRISPDWIKGANFAPVQSTTEKGATDDIKGAIDDTKGCNGLHPHITIIEPSRTIREPSIAPAKRVPSISASQLVEHGVDDQVAAEFLAIRKRKRAPLTAIALEGLMRESAQAGMSLNDALRTCVERGWQGFNAEWVRPKPQAPQRQADRLADWNAKMSEVINRSLGKPEMIDMGVIDASE